MRTSEVLYKGADLIVERGWNQGDAPGPNGEVCLVQAVADVTRNHVTVWFRAIDAVSDFLGWQTVQGPIHKWNDAKGRTAAEVVEVMRATAALEEARETVDTVPLTAGRITLAGGVS